MLTDVVAGHDNVFLKLPVDHLIHTFNEQAFLVFGKQRVPLLAPDDLDDIPAGPTENTF